MKARSKRDAKLVKEFQTSLAMLDTYLHKAVGLVNDLEIKDTKLLLKDAVRELNELESICNKLKLT